MWFGGYSVAVGTPKDAYFRRNPRKKLTFCHLSRCFYYSVLMLETNDAKLKYGGILRNQPKSKWPPYDLISQKMKISNFSLNIVVWPIKMLEITSRIQILHLNILRNNFKHWISKYSKWLLYNLVKKWKLPFSHSI